MRETETTDPKNYPRIKIPFPLGLKLALIVTLIILGSIWTITSLLGLIVSTEFVRTAEDTNFAINSRAASGIEERLYRIRSEALMLIDMSSITEVSSPLVWQQLRNTFFERNPTFAAVVIPGVQEFINRQFFINNEMPPDILNDWLAMQAGTIEQARRNVPAIRNVTPELGISLLAFFYPWQGSGFERAMVVFFSPQSLSEITAAGSSSTMVVNGDGDVLIHPDFSQVQAGANISGNAFFDALKKDPGETVRITYTEGRNRFVAAGQRISFADAAVISTLEYSLITEQIAVINRRSIMLSMIVLFLSILVTWFFSKSITNPVKKLINAAGRIKSGEFYLDLKPSKSLDELGTLTDRFIEMGKGISRWEEMRDLVGNYNSREIVNKAMSGELALDGDRLQAVILSVDFISFSAISGKLEAEESLNLLNSFIAKMINCIERTGGVVDKLLGSRIIALWGIPFSSGDIAGEALKSLNSALMMRNLVYEYNSGKEKSKEPLIRMGCGIHAGEVLAGRIGAFRYNKYTVIGENVDQAVLCGEACAPAEIDIIISKAVRELTAKHIIAEELPPKQFAQGELSMFGLVDLDSYQDKENSSYTLDDVRDFLGGRGNPQNSIK